MRPLRKHVIVIWSETDEAYTDIEAIAREASTGGMYCSVHRQSVVLNPAKDADWDGTEFFNDEAF